MALSCASVLGPWHSALPGLSWERVGGLLPLGWKQPERQAVGKVCWVGGVGKNPANGGREDSRAGKTRSPHRAQPGEGSREAEGMPAESRESHTTRWLGPVTSFVPSTPFPGCIPTLQGANGSALRGSHSFIHSPLN